jgi:hypothetical protein
MIGTPFDIHAKVGITALDFFYQNKGISLHLKKS